MAVIIDRCVIFRADVTFLVRSIGRGFICLVYSFLKKVSMIPGYQMGVKNNLLVIFCWLKLEA